MKRIISAFTVFSLFFLSCNKFDVTDNNKNNNEILKINNVSLTQKEFQDKYTSLNKATNKPIQQCKSETIEAFIYNACLIEYLSANRMILSKENQAKLKIKNRNDFVHLVKKELTKNITVKTSEAKKEFKRYKNKQIVIDFIFIQEPDEQLLNECYDFLKSGGNITDMLYSDKDFFERISSRQGKMRRINVEPGMFPVKISKFISSANREDVKLFSLEEKGHYLIKIIYIDEDVHKTTSLEQIIDNLKIQKYLEIENIKNIWIKSSIDVSKLNNIDLSIRYFDSTDSILVKYGDKLYTKSDVLKIIDKLPFRIKLLFANQSTVPQALTTLILLNNNNKPFSSSDFLVELAGYKSESDIKQLFDYVFLSEFSNSDIYPWLFPFLFENYNKVQINNSLNKTNLIEVNSLNKEAILAFSRTDTFRVSDFYSELNSVSEESIWPILKYNNAVKLIHYYFESTTNTHNSNNVSINHDILKESICYFNSNLAYNHYVYGILSKPDLPRIKINYDLNDLIFSNEEMNIDISTIKTLIDQYPINIQNTLKEDYFNPNKYWRINALITIIEDEFWINRAKDLNLNKSQISGRIKEKNYNSLLVNQFLNSKSEFNDELFDSIANKVFSDNNFKLTFDTAFFSKELPDIYDNKFLLQVK